MDKKNQYYRAYTLIEVMISLGVIGILMSIIIVSYTSITKLYYFNLMINFAHNDVRHASDMITMDIRRAIAYPTVYGTNGNIILSGGEGSEIRIMTEGTYSFTENSAAVGDDTLSVYNPINGSAVALKSLVYGELPTNLNAVTGQPIRTTEESYLISPGDAAQFDITSLETLIIEGVSTNSSKSELQFVNATSQQIPNGTRVVIGKQCRYLAVNWYTNYTTGESRTVSQGEAPGYILSGELRYYPQSGNTNNYRVLVKNLSSETPFIRNSSYYTVDLKYTSKGDITGKGIYRILTHATMRTEPTFLYTSKTPIGGIYALPSGGVSE